MPLPSSGPISLGDIQTEFGGSNPIAINEYYRGGTYVPVMPYTSTIPASGQISFSNFYGEGNKGTPAQAASYLWTNRTNFIRNSYVLTTYPGDNYATNNALSRYSASWTSNFTFNGTGLAIESTKATVLHWAQGSSASITATTTTPALSSTTYTLNWGEISVRADLVNANNNTVTACSQTWSRSANNAGSMGAVVVMPGDYRFVDIAQNPAANSGTNYVRTLESGEFMIVLSGSGPNSNSQRLPSLPAGVYCSAGCFWWYNGGIYQIVMNTTTTAQSVTWATGSGFWGYNRAFIRFYRAN